MSPTKTFEDLTNRKFHSWKVLGFAGYKVSGKDKRRYWTCNCRKCNRVRDVVEYALRKGKSRQCEFCARKSIRTHGERRRRTLERRYNPIYNAWKRLKTYHRNDMCPEWLVIEGGKGYKSFAKDVGLRPSPNYKICRFDSSKPWGPKNIYWKRYRSEEPKTYLFDGESYTVRELAFLADMSPSTMSSRLKKMSPEKAVKCRVTSSYSNQVLKAFGETKTLQEWMNDPRMVVPRKKFLRRLRADWDVEKAMSTIAKCSNPDVSQLVYTAFGETKTLREWADDPRYQPKKYFTFLQRIRNGWDVEKAISEPVKDYAARNRDITAFGETKSLKEWVKDDRFKVSKVLFQQRIRFGFPPEEAMSEHVKKRRKSKFGTVESPLIVELV